jgi:hypothetical protein
MHGSPGATNSSTGERIADLLVLSAIVRSVNSMTRSERLAEQLDWHWREHLRPQMDGLTDEEYFWEPVRGCWSIRPRGTSTASMPGGSQEWTADFASPAPVPAPVTTIAWRMAHIIVSCLGYRAHM